MKRTKELRRTKRLKSTPLRPKKRSAAERERIYGPKGRVEWVKSLWCLACAAPGPNDNAHTVTGGMGRKADYDTIVPLCRKHHQDFDQHRGLFATEAAREGAKAAARTVERLWQEHQRKSGLTPLSAIVPGVVADIERGRE